MIALVDAFAAGAERSPQTISQRYLRRNDKIDDLRRGADLTTRVFEDGLRGMHADWKDWPNGTKWPDGVPRPTQ